MARFVAGGSSGVVRAWHEGEAEEGQKGTGGENKTVAVAAEPTQVGLKPMTQNASPSSKPPSQYPSIWRASRLSPCGVRSLPRCSDYWTRNPNGLASVSTSTQRVPIPSQESRREYGWV